MEVSAQPQDPADVPLGKCVPSFHWTGGWVSHTASLKHLEEDKNLSVPQPSANSLAATTNTLSCSHAGQTQMLVTSLHLLHCCEVVDAPVTITSNLKQYKTLQMTNNSVTTLLTNVLSEQKRS
jgi:hypothetical protein